MVLKKLNKKLAMSVIFAASVAAVASANAAVDGAYLGGTLGYGSVHQNNNEIPYANSSKTTGPAGRVFGGYQFTQNFAVELGYSKFTNATSKLNISNSAFSYTAKSSISTSAVDLVGKAILPLQNCFDVYGKAGVAYLSATDTVTQTFSVPGFGSGSFKDHDSAHHLYPTFGAGVDYNITKNLVADVSWSHIQKVGSSHELKNTDLFGVGVSYHFG